MDLHIFLGMCAELKDLNLKIVYDFGCYLEDPEEQE